MSQNERGSDNIKEDKEDFWATFRDIKFDLDRIDYKDSLPPYQLKLYDHFEEDLRGLEPTEESKADLIRITAELGIKPIGEPSE